MKRLIALGAAIGAALSFFFDPQSGARRRKQTADRVLAFFRRTGTQAGRVGQAPQCPLGRRDLFCPIYRIQISSRVARIGK